MSASSQEVRSIIDTICGDGDRIPVFDQTAYDVSLDYWKQALFDVVDYESKELQWTTLLRIAEISNDFEFYNHFSRHLYKTLHLDSVFDVEDFFTKMQYREVGAIEHLNTSLLELFDANGLSIEADRIRRNQRQRFSMKKREIVRYSYNDYYENLVAESFAQYWKDIVFPGLMLDRVNINAFCVDYFSYKSDVKSILRDTQLNEDFAKFIETDRAMYTREQLSAAGYSSEEMAMYLPTDLDKQFDFMDNRSILSVFTEDDPEQPGEKRCCITNKPKIARDGSGYSYIWREEGITYRFTYLPPKGRPVALLAYLNMQEIVWKHIREKHPEFVYLYDKQFLKDSNFIPTECVQLYKRYEKTLFRQVVDKIRHVYGNMMELRGFTGASEKKIEVRVNQCEVCWNNPLPIDPCTHLWRKFDKLHNIGLSPVLDAGTPLLVTEFCSDVDTGMTMFAHKEYRKTKEILRSEIILKSGLKNKVVLPGFKLQENDSKNLTLSDYAFIDLDKFKKYVYYRLHFRYQQMLRNEKHGYFDWRNADYVIKDEKMRGILADVLLSFEDLPDWLKNDVSLFDSLVDQEYLTRKFFTNLTDKQYRLGVTGSKLFEKISHGKFRLKHDAVPEYRKVRRSLSSAGLPAIDELVTK